jgi:pyruvate,orthophosphate dikinase
VRAIIEAAIRCVEEGVPVLPEIMIPLSIDGRELALLIARTRAVADAIIKERKATLTYLVGTMVETPRAALLADRMAETAEFFSFGTNDLTQLTMGLSRDDAGRFLPDYLAETPKLATVLVTVSSDLPSDSNRQSTIDNRQSAFSGSILPRDPFQSLDTDGVGALVRMSCEKGRSVRPKIKLGICGEHGGDPMSIEFCEKVGLDYVSCSPFRVPVARLAAAQAAIASGSSSGGRSGRRAPQPRSKPSRTKASRSKKSTGKAKRFERVMKSAWKSKTATASARAAKSRSARSTRSLALTMR